MYNLILRAGLPPVVRPMYTHEGIGGLSPTGAYVITVMQMAVFPELASLLV